MIDSGYDDSTPWIAYEYLPGCSLRDLLSHMLAEDTGQTQEKVAQDTDRDFIMTAEEAVTYGVIDEVITARTVAPLEAIGAA